MSLRNKVMRQFAERKVSKKTRTMSFRVHPQRNPSNQVPGLLCPHSYDWKSQVPYCIQISKIIARASAKGAESSYMTNLKKRQDQLHGGAAAPGW